MLSKLDLRGRAASRGRRLAPRAEAELEQKGDAREAGHRFDRTHPALLSFAQSSERKNVMPICIKLSCASA